MIFYIIVAILFFGSAGFIVARHRLELNEYGLRAQHPPTFAHFMEDFVHELYALWRSHLREQILIFTEKQLRLIRILVLRVERVLFHATHRVRGASNRNGSNHTGEKPEDSLQ